MERDLYVTDLGGLLGSWVVNVVGAEIGEHRDLPCAARREQAGWAREPVAKAAEEDHDRWLGAADRLLAAVRALQTREKAASLHLERPWRGGVWWRLRHARRNRRLRRDYNRVVGELRDEFAAAVIEYTELAGDLPGYVTRYQDEQRRRRDREESEAEQRRTEAMRADTGPSWAYEIHEHQGWRGFWISLAALDTPRTRTGLTPAQIQQALATERAEHPYTSVNWDWRTGLALREKYGSEGSGWATLTGETIDTHPRDPSQHRSHPRRFGGPSSNYSDGGHSGAIGGSF